MKPKTLNRLRDVITFRKTSFNLQRLLVFPILFLVTNACQEEVTRSRATPDVAPEPGLFELSFEAEHLMLPGLKSESTASSQEKIQAMPFSDRSKIRIMVYDDGTADWRLEKRKPKHDFTVRHQTPPNPQPEAKRTHIDRTGMGYFYDQDDHLLYQHKITPPTFAEAVALVKRNPQAIFAAMGIKPAERLDLLLADAKAKGGVVQHLDNGIVSVRIAGGNNKSGTHLRVPGVASDYTTVDLYNEKLGVLMGSTLYDLQENIVSQSFFKYTMNDRKQAVPQVVHTEVWDVHPRTGERIKTTSETYFENVVVTINN